MFKLNTKRWRLSAATFVLAMVASICFSIGKFNLAQAADFNVIDEAGLAAALASADTNINIVVENDITITAQKTIPANKNVTITSADPDNPARLIRDVNFAGYLINAGVADTTLTLENIILDGNKSNVIVPVDSSLVFAPSAQLFEGTVLRNNSTSGRGGAIYVTRSLTMNGGLIADNESRDGGGGIFSSGFTFINGGIITRNTSTERGGGIWQQDRVITVTGGEISNNAAVADDNFFRRGGGIVVTNDGDAVMTGGAITKNTAVEGGGIYMDGENAIFDMSGGTISENIASSSGGGIFGGGTISGGEISNNQASSGGGIYFSTTGSSYSKALSITGGLFDNNTSTGSGGGIYANIGLSSSDLSGTFTMTNGEVTNNQALNGGGVYITGYNSDASIIGSVKIESNNAQNGGGIYINNYPIVILQGLSITKNTATVSGGGVYITRSQLANLTVDLGSPGSSTFSNNTASFSTTAVSNADITTYNSNIHTTNWSNDANGTPLSVGYNNYDIAYPQLTTYTVTFSSNGGSSVESQIVVFGDKAIRPADPTRPNYAFSGWYTNTGLTSAYNFDSTVTENRTLYAKWTATYTVSFDSNGGSSIEDQTVTSGTAAAEPDDPLRTGYTFAGWYSDAGLTTAWNFVTTVTTDRTLYAKWTINVYEVTFVDENGNIIKTETVEYGFDATAPDAPVRDGYTFVGWDTAFNNITGDLVVTAIYERNPDIPPSNILVVPGAPNTGVLNWTHGKFAFRPYNFSR